MFICCQYSDDNVTCMLMIGSSGTDDDDGDFQWILGDTFIRSNQFCFFYHIFISDHTVRSMILVMHELVLPKVNIKIVDDCCIDYRRLLVHLGLSLLLRHVSICTQCHTCQ